jgi:hypothetical protein
VATFRAALKEMTRERAPLQCAMTQKKALVDLRDLAMSVAIGIIASDGAWTRPLEAGGLAESGTAPSRRPRVFRRARSA